MPLFAAADRGGDRPWPELREPAVSLPAMTAGREVVEDYRSKGLSLRAHPLAFLRGDLASQGFAPCADLKRTTAGSRTGACACAPNAGLGERRHVHYARGRDGNRQSDRLAFRVREIPARDRCLLHAGLPGQGAARGRGDPCDRRAPRRSFRRTAPREQTRSAFPVAGRTRRRRPPDEGRIPAGGRGSGASRAISTSRICGSKRSR